MGPSRFFTSPTSSSSPDFDAPGVNATVGQVVSFYSGRAHRAFDDNGDFLIDERTVDS